MGEPAPRHGLADDGDYRRAAECLRRIVEALQGDRRYERWEHGLLASVFARTGSPGASPSWASSPRRWRAAEEAVRIAREIDHPASLVVGYRSLGLVSSAAATSCRPFRRWSAPSSSAGTIPVPALFDVSAAHLGYAYALSGRLAEGVALLEEALADPAATGIANHPLFLAHLGEAHLLAGRRDDALAVARRALDLAHRQKERGNEAWVLRLLGEIAAQADPPDLESAEEHYRQALARADELGMRPLVAHCHLGLGKLYRRTGDGAKAEEHLTTAAREDKPELAGEAPKLPTMASRSEEVEAGSFSCRMGPIDSGCFTKPPSMWTRSSRESSPPTSPSSSLPNSTWSST